MPWCSNFWFLFGDLYSDDWINDALSFYITNASLLFNFSCLIWQSGDCSVKVCVPSAGADWPICHPDYLDPVIKEGQFKDTATVRFRFPKQEEPTAQIDMQVQTVAEKTHLFLLAKPTTLSLSQYPIQSYLQPLRFIYWLYEQIRNPNKKQK